MKLQYPLLGILLFASASITARDHSTNPDSYFLTIDQAPNSLELLPAPPADSTARFAYDREQYEWGKSLRSSERGRLAVADATIGPEWVNDIFGEAFGYDISRDNAPEICRLLANMREDAGDLSTRHAKDHYMRTRPFAYWNEQSGTPDHESWLRTNGSYPSGHTAIGWAAALVLAEINPDAATEILKRGYEFGQSRVIVGAHYQSDVDMGRLMASAIVASLHSDKAFNRQLQKAKKEFTRLKNAQAKAKKHD